MTRFRILLISGLTAVLSITVGPRSSLHAQQSTASAEKPHQRASRDFILREQFNSHPDLVTAYSIVEALRGNWLQMRNVVPTVDAYSRPFRVPDGARAPAGMSAGVQVYLDGHRLGGVELLRNIPSRGVYSIRHLNGIEAQALYGAGHSEGVILVATSAAW